MTPSPAHSLLGPPDASISRHSSEFATSAGCPGPTGVAVGEITATVALHVSHEVGSVMSSAPLITRLEVPNV